MQQHLIQPILTEKSLREAAAGRYSFLVSKAATKNSLRTAIATAFSVNVTRINTVIIPGKTRRSRTGRTLTSKATKKAIVTLKSGQTIAAFTKVLEKK